MIPTYNAKAAPPGAVNPMQNPVAVTSSSVLQVALIWNGKILGYRLVGRRQTISIGPSPRATFVTPAVRSAASKRTFALLVPARPRGRHQLRLGAGLRGQITRPDETVNVADLLASGGGVETVDFNRGDRARLTLDDAPGLRLEIRYVEPPPFVPRPRFADTEPFLARVMALTAATIFLVVAAVMLFAPDDPPRTLVISAERMAKILPPAPPPPPPPEPPGKKEKEKEKTKEDSGQMKKAKEAQGKLGRHDAQQKDTIIPKGEKDILRDKVVTKGLLGILGKERNESSGLGKLFANDSLEVEQAVAGMKGATLVAGRGAGGLSTTGTGIGGGGTGTGHIYGAGNIDTGGHSTRGKGKSPSLAPRAEREVKLDVGGGGVEEGGGLSREQVNKVVRAHLNAVKFCYEKELQHNANLSGRVVTKFTIAPNGKIVVAVTDSSTMNDPRVDACVADVFKRIELPAMPANMGVSIVTYPLAFHSASQQGL